MLGGALSWDCGAYGHSFASISTFRTFFLVYHRPPGGDGARKKDTVHKLGSHARYGMQAHLLATLEYISSQWNEIMRLL